MAKLTKRDIVVSISNQTGMVQHQVFDVVQKTLDKITDSLANNIPVELRNFGYSSRALPGRGSDETLINRAAASSFRRGRR